MEVRRNWYDNVVKEINLHKDSLSKRERRRYKLDLLLRIAKRVDDFSTMCGECQMFQPEITRLTKDLGDVVNISRETRRSYFKTIGNIIKHLRKHHKLVTAGQYMGMGIAFGVGIGIAIGAALDNPSIGPGIGIGIGVAIGSYMDNKAKKEGKVI